MIVEYMCPPAILYLAFSVTQIIIDMFRGDTNTAFLKFIVMIIFTVVLNLLCSAGLGIISWFIVFIPFILMTYITTVLAFVFGIPKKDNLRPERPERKSREDHERERNHDIVGGCAGTRYGCCYDGTTAKADDRGSNCPHRPRPDPRPKPKPEPKPHPEPKPPHKKGCAEELYGCCEDGTTTRPCPKGMVPIPNKEKNNSEPDPTSSQSSLYGACAGSEFGCCSDKKTYAIAKSCKGETSPVI
jgi:hypothetical protein